MRQSTQTTQYKGAALLHPHWQLVERASSSTALKNSPRLLQLFHYLCERALSAPGEFISEQQVGAEVFGRSPGYNSDGDTIVRTQISQLRKRLLQYFLSEGSDEPTTIEIPVGSYLPVFHPRTEPARPPREAQEAHRPVAPGPAPGSRAAAYSIWALVAVLTIACGWLVWQNSHLRATRVVPSSHSPYLDHFWNQLLNNGQQTYIVTSDANAMLFSDFMDRPITLKEYRSPSYPNDLLKTWIKDPQASSFLKHFMSTYFTGSQDGQSVARLTQMGERYKTPTDVIYARDFRWQAQTHNNVILLGHRKANPWVELFDNQLNFGYEWHAEARKGLLRNRKPKAGESETYEWNVPPNTTYATLAYIPTTEATVLLIGGSDMTAVDAGSRFLCDEGTIHELFTALARDLTQRVPYFEALIVARRARNVAYDPQVISVRILEPQIQVAQQLH